MNIFLGRMKKIKKYIKDFIAKQQYKRSFKRAAKDHNIMSVAEEGMADYAHQLKVHD